MKEQCTAVVRISRSRGGLNRKKLDDGKRGVGFGNSSSRIKSNRREQCFVVVELTCSVRFCKEKKPQRLLVGVLRDRAASGCHTGDEITMHPASYILATRPVTLHC